MSTGNGTFLGSPMSAAAFASHRPSFSCTNPKNIFQYTRHGFEVMGEIQHGARPIITPMLRQPR